MQITKALPLLLMTIPGVSPEDREQIFRPFYRTDEARDRESGGTGLGLAIVETAVSQHRGWVRAEDSPLGGLRLTIWLPLHPLKA